MSLTPLERFPGPWTLRQRLAVKESNIYCGSTPIALCVPDALAPLIAAAPDLLAACKDALAYIMRASPPGAYIATEKLAAAIAKAGV